VAEAANACDAAPNAVDSELVAEAPVPIATERSPSALASKPDAKLLRAVASAPEPKALA